MPAFVIVSGYPAAFAREAGCELIEVRPFYTTARRILKGKVGLYARVAMAVTDRTSCVHPAREALIKEGTPAHEAIHPEKMVATSRCRRYFPTLPADVRQDVCVRMREFVEGERAFYDEGNYVHIAQISPRSPSTRCYGSARETSSRAASA